jgi:hypothetical protein
MARHEPVIGRYYDRFDLLFLVTLATVALLLLVDLNQQQGLFEILSIIVTVLTAVTLVLAVAAAGIGRRGLRLAWIAAVSTVALSVAALFLPMSTYSGGGLVWLLLVVAAPVVALKRLVRHEQVTFETVLGAVSVFLLMAVAGTYLFLFIDAIGTSDGGRFFGHPEPTTVFMYFSIVTITTLGYGDFAPTEVMGRAASAWIAISGQIYLVVVVARMVAVFSGPGRRDKARDSAAEDD